MARPSARAVPVQFPFTIGDDLRSHSPSAFIIDDEGGICAFIALTLDAVGIKAESFPSAELAVESLQSCHPDFVFLDIALKNSDAIEVIRILGAKQYRGVVQLMSGSDIPLLNDVHRIGIRKKAARLQGNEAPVAAR